MAPATSSTTTFLLFLLLSSSSLFFHGVRSDDASDDLLRGLNQYRTSQKLRVLEENKNAECLAEHIVEQLEDQSCANTTGAFFVQGTEKQFPNYPAFLQKCHLNASVTRSGSLMPACVPDLNSQLVLSNYTKTQYAKHLKKPEYVGVGIADEGDWIVVVLTTNTPTGSFEKATGRSSTLELSYAYQIMLSLLLAATFLLPLFI